MNDRPSFKVLFYGVPGKTIYIFPKIFTQNISRLNVIKFIGGYSSF